MMATTEKTVKKLTIHKMKKKDYAQLPSKSADEMYLLTDVGGQVSEITSASADYVGEIVQYVGETNDTYTNGFFYKCVETDGAYSWTQVNVQGGGGASLPDQTDNAGKFLTTDGTTASWGNAVANTATKSNQLNITTLNGEAITPDRGGTSINIGENIYGGAFNDYGGIRIGKNINTAKYGHSNGVYIARGGILYAGGGVIISGGASIYGNGSGKVGGIIISGDGNLRIDSKGAYSTLIGSCATNFNFTLKADYTTAIVNGFSSGEVTEDNTFWWGNQNGLYKLFDTDGNVPRERLKNLVEVFPTEDNGYVTVKNYGNGYVEISGCKEIGTVDPSGGDTVLIEFPEGYELIDTYWANASCTSDADMFSFKVEVKTRSVHDLVIAYKNEDDSTGLDNAVIFWEVRGMLFSTLE